MYRLASPPTPSCPRCRRSLQPRTRERDEYHLCARCSGIFLDLATFNRLWYELARDNVESAPPAELRARPAIYRLPCPVCRGKMERVDLLGVPIDRCPVDGLWFDPPELETLLMAAKVPFHDWLRRFASRLPSMR
jgi:Zn-finger nucleic acid-binding protein